MKKFSSGSKICLVIFFFSINPNYLFSQKMFIFQEFNVNFNVFFFYHPHRRNIHKYISLTNLKKILHNYVETLRNMHILIKINDSRLVTGFVNFKNVLPTDFGRGKLDNRVTHDIRDSYVT